MDTINRMTTIRIWIKVRDEQDPKILMEEIYSFTFLSPDVTLLDKRYGDLGSNVVKKYSDCLREEILAGIERMKELN